MQRVAQRGQPRVLQRHAIDDIVTVGRRGGVGRAKPVVVCGVTHGSVLAGVGAHERLPAGVVQVEVGDLARGGRQHRSGCMAVPPVACRVHQLSQRSGQVGHAEPASGVIE